MSAMNAAILVALFAPDLQMVANEVFQIPAKEWRYVDVPVKQVPVAVRCEFQVLSGNGAVRAELVNADGLEEWKQGHQDAKASGILGAKASFSRVVTAPDSYAVIVENRGREPLSVRLYVSLDSSERARPQARYLSLERRVTVIGISAIVFLSMVSYSAKKLLSAMRG